MCFITLSRSSSPLYYAGVCVSYPAGGRLRATALLFTNPAEVIRMWREADSS
jgi:hypothetical protein